MKDLELNGIVIEWGHTEWDQPTIQEHEVEEYENRGYNVMEFMGRLLAAKSLSNADGTIELQPKSDMLGRMASAGGKANLGYSGYFKGYVWVDGKRRKLTNFWTLFPNKEHNFAAQQDKRSTEERIRKIVEPLRGLKIVKVKGGYELAEVTVRESESTN